MYKHTYTHSHRSARPVNTHSYRGEKYSFGYIGGMDIPKTLTRIMSANGWRQGDLAKALGVKQPTISRYLKGMDPGGEVREEIKKLAAEALDEGVGSTPILRGLYAPLISWVSAGNLRSPDAIAEIDGAPRIYAPDLEQKGDWIALRVEGDSMDRISPPESVIFVNLKDRRLVPNACYVIADTDTGEATYKRWRPSPDRWEPVSVNPAHEPFFPPEDQVIKVIGRVRKSVLAM